MDKVKNTARAIIMFALLFLILIFCFQNRDEVAISFFKMKLESVPLFIALIGTLSTGLLIGFLAGLITGTKTKRETLRKKNESRELQERPTNENPTDL